MNRLASALNTQTSSRFSHTQRTFFALLQPSAATFANSFTRFETRLSSKMTKITLLTGLTLASIATVLAAPSNISHIESRASPRVYTKCVNSGDFALTFDECVHCCSDECVLTIIACSGPYKYHKKVRKALYDADVKGTFFLNGNNCAISLISARQHAHITADRRLHL